MKTIILLLFFFLCLVTVGLKSQNAPVTTAGIITNATTAPGAVSVPITVSNFVSIGYFTLTLRYQADRVTYVSFTPHPSFPGMTVTNTVAGTYGKLVITWPQTPGGVTLPGATNLLDLTFTYISSTSVLAWLYNVGDNVCEYKKYSGGSYILLNDNPEQSYYINGGISNRGAPVTFAPVISNPSPGPVSIPLTVDNFNAIGSINLNLEYDQSVLTFQNCVLNPALVGGINIGNNMGPNGKMLVVISVYGLAPVNLPNGSTLATLNFIYSNTSGSWSGIDFLETGSSCEYTDPLPAGNPLIDSPAENFYHNGLVYTQYSPKAWLPVIINAVPAGTVTLPVYVRDFNNVRSLCLSFEYTGAVMTYGSFTPSGDFGSALTATESPSGSKRKVAMNWTGVTDKTLPDGSLLGTVNFNYNSGTTPLTWMVADGTSCRFNDAGGNSYCDVPRTTYYQDGLVASHIAPVSAGGQQSAVSGQPVVVPVNVYDFSNIGLFSLALDYDPSVLTYQSASLVPAIDGTFNASTAGLGRILMNWSGTAISLADNSTLIHLTFLYNEGSTALAWFDDGNSCRFSETLSGSSLYDLPPSIHYINGYVGPDPLVADFAANQTSGDNNVTISFTDQTSGSPSGWNWSLSPSTYYFVNGTSASSQDPQVKFTSNGAYTVTLIVTRGTGSAIEIKTDFLHIGTPGLWTGITSSDWNVNSNWHNYTIPANSVNVLIPDAAPNWPHKTGDLSVGGSHCLSLTLQGNARLTINGDLAISNGSFLDFTGPGLLTLGGNWANSGVFNCGTGTVDFTGLENATLFSTSSPENFYKVIVSKSGAKLSVQGIIHFLGVE